MHMYVILEQLVWGIITDNNPDSDGEGSYLSGLGLIYHIVTITNSLKDQIWKDNMLLQQESLQKPTTKSVPITFSPFQQKVVMEQ